jgi:hypothetical protein
MRLPKRPSKSILVAIAVIAAAALAGCGSSGEPKISASGVLVNQTATSPGQIILTQLGAQRIGVRTAPARTGNAPASVVIPYSAVVYDPSGKTYAFTNPRPLMFVEVPISIDRIAGNSVYVTRGPKAGAQVVTVGAEELYGVQTGVLAQT